jgi:FAD/FMN-containing dehydrogenase
LTLLSVNPKMPLNENFPRPFHHGKDSLLTAISTFDDAALAELRADLLLPIITPADPDYDSARRIWNAMVDKRPALIVPCISTADVVAAIRFAREQGLPLSVKGGGHGVAGKAICEGGVVIDLSPMQRISVDPERRTARAEGGVKWGELDAETQAHGLATTGGVIPSTGIAGLTLGGGLGFLMRRFGLACDNLISADVITADGEILTASAEKHPDLFWGLRGAGTNFGVVTSFEYQLHPVGPKILGGLIVHSIDHAREVCRFYREVTAAAPDELMVYLGFGNSPDGEKTVALLVVYSSDLSVGEKLVQPFRNFGSPIADTIAPITYSQLQRFFESTYPPGRRNYWKSNFLSELTDEAIEIMIDGARTMPSPYSYVGLEQLGGAVGRVGSDATALADRDAAFTVLFTSAWEDAADTDANVQWARRNWGAIQPQARESVYINYVDAGDENRVSSAYGENYARLTALKRKYDPKNVFSSTLNIAPAP